MQRSNPGTDGQPGTGPGTGPLGTGHGEEIKADLCIIGAGSGGLSLAASTVQLGLKVVLIEKHKMGGDCLNYGCVPSKALIAAARRAQMMRNVGPFGIAPVMPQIDFARVHGHVHGVIAAIAPNDSVERFTGLGVQVIQAAGRFADRHTVVAGDKLIRASRYCIATGSSPAVPPIPGLDKVPYLTNETIFDNREPIGRLIVIGGGPIGIEMAQAHLRLGAQVVVLEGMKALGKDDPELAQVVLARLRSEGLVIREGAKVEQVEAQPGGIRVTFATADGTETVDGTHLLVAAGRKPNVSDLNLEVAGINFDRRGIQVSSSLLTTNPKVFAIGDVAGRLQFTHVANYHAGIVFRHMLLGRLAPLLGKSAKVREDHVPWVTYTDPELANVGLTEDEARKRHGHINVYRWPFHENDRAQAERASEGFVKVLTDKKGRIVGAGIVGEHAGEIIQMWSLAISQGLGIKAMTQWISPYPTLSEVNKRAALGYYAAKAGSPLVRKVVSLVRKLG
jgi:pyruvate/2-oxoglutarate dehydrogenase complex dihydrolipoamide dehydrogenase (E3) component